MPSQAAQRTFPIPLHSGQGETLIFFLFREVRLELRPEKRPEVRLGLEMRPELVVSSTIHPAFDPLREDRHFGQSANPVWLQRRQGSTPLHQHVVQGSLSARSSGGRTLNSHVS